MFTKRGTCRNLDQTDGGRRERAGNQDPASQLGAFLEHDLDRIGPATGGSAVGDPGCGGRLRREGRAEQAEPHIERSSRSRIHSAGRPQQEHPAGKQDRKEEHRPYEPAVVEVGAAEPHHPSAGRLVDPGDIVQGQEREERGQQPEHVRPPRQQQRQQGCEEGCGEGRRRARPGKGVPVHVGAQAPYLSVEHPDVHEVRRGLHHNAGRRNAGARPQDPLDAGSPPLPHAHAGTDGHPFNPRTSTAMDLPLPQCLNLSYRAREAKSSASHTRCLACLLTHHVAGSAERHSLVWVNARTAPVRWPRHGTLAQSARDRRSGIHRLPPV
jgi:hypothetical protein